MRQLLAEYSWPMQYVYVCKIKVHHQILTGPFQSNLCYQKSRRYYNVAPGLSLFNCTRNVPYCILFKYYGDYKK